ncbi:MAG: MarR family winged helix-turn-helix transcriptional regulator [Clostridiaceae bacterium]
MSSYNQDIEELSQLWHILIPVGKNILDMKEFEHLRNVTELEIGIIGILSKKKQPLFKDVCNELVIPKSTLTNAVKRLEKNNYVKRNINTNDRRSFNLQLTTEGEVLQKEHIIYENMLCKLILGGLNEEERTKLLQILKKTVKNIHI